MSSSGEGRPPFPFRLTDVLSSAYSTLMLLLVLIGLISFIVSMRWRLDEIEKREQEHPTRSELATIALKVDERLNNLEKRLSDLDQYGTRALADRTTLIEQQNHAQDERILDITRRLTTVQENVNKLGNEIPVIIDRQNSNTQAVKDLQQRVWSSGGERGPTAPPAILMPQYPPKF